MAGGIVLHGRVNRYNPMNLQQSSTTLSLHHHGLNLLANCNLQSIHAERVDFAIKLARFALFGLFHCKLLAMAAMQSVQPHSEPVWRASEHIPALDGVRGLAILAVTLYRFGKDLPTSNWFERSLQYGIQFGNHGVDLFFVLSGFLITGVLIDSKKRPNYLLNFFVRRSLRIFPLYFTALMLFLILLPALYGTRQPFQLAVENQFYLWTYLTNVKMSLADAWCFGSLDHFWSLAVEEHFYLLWPFVIYFCSPRMSLAIGHHPRNL